MFQDELTQRVDEIAQKLEIRQKTIVKFLFLISHKQNLSSKDLIRKLGLPQIHLYRLIHEFTEILEPKTNYIFVKSETAKEIAEFTKKRLSEYSIQNLENIKKIIKKYQKIRPKPNRNLDQFTATVSTTIRRVDRLSKNDDLKGKKIAFLGDDDLVSVAVALTRQCKKITVFEIDDRLNNFIAQISKENNLEIEIIKQNICQRLDKKWFEKFDVVFTDPPYTKEGVDIFLNQAIRLIKKNFLGRIYLCYGNSDRAREREVEIQKLILNHNLIIKTKFNQFNRYFGAESIGSQSSLYVLDWTPSTKIINSNLKKIYTND